MINIQVWIDCKQGACQQQQQQQHQRFSDPQTWMCLERLLAVAGTAAGNFCSKSTTPCSSCNSSAARWQTQSGDIILLQYSHTNTNT
jgi:hypothetical protein